MAIKEFLVAVFSNWVEAVGIILAVLPFIEKLPRVKAWLQDKPFLERYAWLLWIVGGFCIVYGFYSAWFEQRIAATEAQKKFDELSKPKLSIEILEIIQGDIEGLPEEKRGLRVFFQVSIKNLGAPSIADSFLVTIEKGDLKRTTQPIFIYDGYTVTGGSDKHVIAKFKRGDALYEKTSSPIERGDKKTGWLLVEFEGINHEQMSGPGRKFVVQCSDVTGEKIYATRIIGQGTILSNRPLYFPGSEQPFTGIKDEDLRKK